MLTVGFDYRKEKSRYIDFSPEQAPILKGSTRMAVVSGVLTRHRVLLLNVIVKDPVSSSKPEW